jgi:hypothetical protein
MAKKSIEEMLNIPSHKEIQIKTTLRCQLNPVRMSIIKNTNNDKYQQRCV